MTRPHPTFTLKPMYLVVSFFPIDGLGGGERWTINAFRAMLKRYPGSELFNARVQNGATVFERLEYKGDLCVKVVESMGELRFSQYSQRFSHVWIHQYCGYKEVIPFLVTFADKQIALTNHGYENFKFFAHYSPLKSHRFYEVSDYSRQRTMRYNIPANKLYGGVWEKEIMPATARSVAAKQKNSFAICGRIVRLKRFELAINALEKGSLTIIGDHTKDRVYVRELRKSAKNKDVRFAGAVSDDRRTEIIRSSKALLACSSRTSGAIVCEHTELFGLVLAEAVAAGTIPVASNVKAFVEVMGEFGLSDYVFEENNTDDLRERMRAVAALSQGEYLEKITAAQAALRKKMTWDTLPERMICENSYC